MVNRKDLSSRHQKTILRMGRPEIRAIRAVLKLAIPMEARTNLMPEVTSLPNFLW